MVPDLAAPVFLATWKFSVPLPVPEAPELTVIQLSPVVEVQEHDAVTPMEPTPPSAAKRASEGLSVMAQRAPAWLTVNVCPPTVIVPVRLWTCGFGVTVKETTPSPEPLAPPVIWIHGTDGAAVQLQPLVTFIEPVPPLAGSDACAGLRETVQGGAGCETRNTAVPTRIVPERVEVVLFAETVKLTRPSPVPLVADVIEIHGTSGTAVQLQVVSMENDPLPPLNGTVASEGDRTKLHVAATCVTGRAAVPIVTDPLREKGSRFG
jgi:hypothetical protein